MEEISSFIVPGSVAAVIMALSVFLIRAVKTSTDVNADTVAALRLENKTIRAERDYERNEKHDWAEHSTKLMYYIEEEHYQFARFLESQKIDPTLFQFRDLPRKSKREHFEVLEEQRRTDLRPGDDSSAEGSPR